MTLSFVWHLPLKKDKNQLIYRQICPEILIPLLIFLFLAKKSTSIVNNPAHLTLKLASVTANATVFDLKTVALNFTLSYTKYP